MKKDLIVFIDSGDTIIDELTEIYNLNGDVLRADMITGAYEMITNLYKSGYRISLVADGRAASFRNVYEYYGLMHIFEGWIVSEEQKVNKPHPLMFQRAMEALGLDESDKHRIVMIGNNLKRDILGANKMGITSILLSFSPRYVMQPTCKDEIPDYVAAMPCEIPPLLEQLNLQVKNKRILALTGRKIADKACD